MKETFGDSRNLPQVMEEVMSKRSEHGSVSKKQVVLRIYGITYHISSSPYYSEGMHTKYKLKLPKGVMTQG